MTRKDRELGMHREITRRDFLNGVAVGFGTLGAAHALPSWAESEPAGTAHEDYPPALTGIRGSTDQSYKYAHRIRDGKPFDLDGFAKSTGETYDLVVIGGGISGLAAAYFFRKQTGEKARILILENHDDFGGHARRNEFQVGNRTLLCYGGTQSIESPGKYSPQAAGLLKELGIDTGKFFQAYDEKLYSSMKLGTAVFFDKETFGEDRLVPGYGSLPWQDFLAKAPLSEELRREIARVYTEKVDYLPGLTLEQKRAKLAKISYADFLTQICKLKPDALKFFQSYTNDLFAVGIDAVPALACFEQPDDYGGYHYAGFQGMNLEQGTPEEEEPYIFHFPDGNASIARLLVRSLIPGSIPGHTMEDVVLAKADYSKLDRESASVRLRLHSTAVNVRHVGPNASGEVEIAYERHDKLASVRAKNCVLACYNTMIPYLCPELPEEQKRALRYLVKAPLVYTHVAIRNWTSFQKLGIRHVEAPGSYHTYVALDFPVTFGEYKFPRNPEEPMVLFMLRTPCKPGLPMRTQYRVGRGELLRTPFATFERNIRDQLGRMLRGGGFDPARDIAGITVNRWAHGYAYTPNTLYDPDWPEEQTPWVKGRKQFGRIAIANSDAGASAYTDPAIDQAYRAVGELTKS